MPYQPNYCAHCGEKVDRAVWRLWTSTRFCENCEGELKKVDLLPKIGMAVVGLGGLLGFGSYLTSPQKPPSLIDNQFTVSAAKQPQQPKTEQVTAPLPSPKTLGAQQIGQPTALVSNQSKAAPLAKVSPIPAQAEKPPVIESEPVYFCGAQTKKGTPCTRKVKSATRCWQHAGLAAMLPKEKLATGQ